MPGPVACAACGRPLPPQRAKGRRRRYCDARCRDAARRERARKARSSAVSVKAPLTDQGRHGYVDAMAGIRDTAGQLLAAVGRGGGAPLTAVAAARDLSAATDAALQAAVDRARAAGHSWREVGDVLGTSRQAAFQRFGRPIDPRTGLAMNRALPPGAADRAVAVFAAHDEGRWAEIIEQLDETMRGLHSPELLALGWTRLASMYGRLERIGAPYPTPGQCGRRDHRPAVLRSGRVARRRPVRRRQQNRRDGHQAAQSAP